jgi:antirestriction protein
MLGSVYVGTYAKYNNGDLSGAWLDLDDYSDKEEFLAACKELHADEEEPEFMIQDKEEVAFNDMISESYVDGRIWEVCNSLEDGDDLEALIAFMNAFSISLDNEKIENIVDWFHDSYQGEYESEEAFSDELLNECYDVPKGLKYYIDYGAFCRDIFINDYTFWDGYIFANNY